MLSIILSRRDWRENDQLISFYTKDKGKMEVLARGVKKVLSKNSAYLEPFCFVEAEIISARDLARLGAVAPINIFKNIRNDLEKSLCASYVCNALDKLIEAGERDKNIFELLRSWLEFLNEEKCDPVFLLDVLMVKIFYYLGFDITSHPEFINGSKIKKELENIIKNSWKEICDYNYLDQNKKILHKIIFKFAVYQSDKKLANWAKIIV